MKKKRYEQTSRMPATLKMHTNSMEDEKSEKKNRKCWKSSGSFRKFSCGTEIGVCKYISVFNIEQKELFKCKPTACSFLFILPRSHLFFPKCFGIYIIMFFCSVRYLFIERTSERMSQRLIALPLTTKWAFGSRFFFATCCVEVSCAIFLFFYLHC